MGLSCSISLIHTKKENEPAMIDLVRAYRGLDYLPLAMRRGVDYICVSGYVFVWRRVCSFPTHMSVCVCVFASATDAFQRGTAKENAAC